MKSMLLGKAMAEAAQLFDKQGGAPGGGSKQDVVNSAGQMMMKMLLKQQMKSMMGGGGAAAPGGLSGLMGESESSLAVCKIADRLRNTRNGFPV